MCEKCYCFDGDELFADIDVIIDHCEGELQPGDNVTYMEGDSVKSSHSQWVSKYDVRSLLESISESAFDEVGEVAEDYLTGVTTDQLEKLKSVIGEFLDKNVPPPNFSAVTNIKKVTAVWDGENLTEIE